MKDVVHLDPRTKIYMLLVFNVIMLTSLTEGVSIYLKPILSVLAFLALLNAKMPKKAIIYLALYGIFYHYTWVLPYLSTLPVLSFMIRFLAQMITRMVPCVMFAYAILVTTKVSEFVAAMERMHMSSHIIIPFAVMFRFFPTVGEEYQSIQDAMRLRNLGWNHGLLAMIEYRMVPLIVSLVKIGDELSAAALCRGLGSPIKRTNYCQIGFGMKDGVAWVFMSVILIVYMLF